MRKKQKLKKNQRKSENKIEKSKRLKKYQISQNFTQKSEDLIKTSHKSD